MTDQEQAKRLAAIRAKRGQAPAASPVTEMPAQPASAMRPTKPIPAPTGRTRRAHPAMGARILASGIAASAVFGLTTVIAAASQPVSVAPSPNATVPPATVPPTAAPTTTPPPEPQTIVLTIPPLPVPVTAAPAAAAVPTPPASVAAPVPAAAPKPAPAAAPKPAPAPAAVPAPPAPPATSKPSAP
ncbi:MAG: hypothetical protein ACXVLX_18880 [Ilumatobacteraceae bacterium]